jgi:multiple sugar transport system ATP-binding protein
VTVAGEAPSERKLEAVVDIREDMGSDIYVHFGVGGPLVRGEDVVAAVGKEAIEATEAQARERGNLWVARIGRGSHAQEGERIELVVNTARLRLFDPATGRAIEDELP